MNPVKGNHRIGSYSPTDVRWESGTTLGLRVGERTGGPMPARFCVLASGSAGNCAFVESDGHGLLIDAGLGPRFIAARLAVVGASWRDVHAVVLTHTHSDHWKELTLAHLGRLRIPLFCSAGHHADLTRTSSAFRALVSADSVRLFAEGQPLDPIPGVTCVPMQVPHDSDPTYAFRIDGPAGLFGPQWSLGYASDLGTC